MQDAVRPNRFDQRPQIGRKRDGCRRDLVDLDETDRRTGSRRCELIDIMRIGAHPVSAR